MHSNCDLLCRKWAYRVHYFARVWFLKLYIEPTLSFLVKIRNNDFRKNKIFIINLTSIERVILDRENKRFRAKF